MINVNQPPVADAGPDQTVTDSDGNGTEQVTLDGSGSSDPDGSIISYVWSEGVTQIATGVNPTVDLAAGAHTITLTVTDNDSATNTDEVVINVNQPVPAKTLPRKWDMPELNNPLVFYLEENDSISSDSFPADRDVLIYGATTKVVGGLDIVVGDPTAIPVGEERNVVIIGGKYNGRIAVRGYSGTVYFEGIHIDAEWQIMDAFVASSKANAKTAWREPDIIIQNCYVENLPAKLDGEGPDIYQPQGPIGSLKVYNLTGYSQFEGFMLGKNHLTDENDIPVKPRAEGWYFEKVNLEWPLPDQQKWVGYHLGEDPSWITYDVTFVDAWGDGAGPNAVAAPDAYLDNGKVYFSSVTVNGDGYINFGTPGGGNFVSPDDVGMGYVYEETELDGKIVRIENVETGYWIRPVELVDYSDVEQVDTSFTGSWTQWKIIDSGSGYYRFENVASGRCMRPRSATDYENIYMGKTIWTGSWTHFEVNKLGDGIFRLVNRETGKPIRPVDASEYGLVMNGDVTQTGTYTQWKFIDVSTGQYLKSLNTEQTVTGTENWDASKIVLYPNPSSTGRFTLESSVNIKQLRVYNLTGTVLLDKVMNSRNEDIDLSSFGPGTYLIRMQHDSGLTFRKVLVL